MEMELTLEMTYDDIFNNSFGLSKSYLANILKRVNSDLIELDYRPPFVIIHENNIPAFSIKTNDVLNLFLNLQSPKLGRTSCLKFMEKFFYVVRSEEELIIAKDGEDNCLVMMGSLNLKSLSYLGVFTEYSKRKFIFLKLMDKIRHIMNEEIK